MNENTVHGSQQKSKDKDVLFFSELLRKETRDVKNLGNLLLSHLASFTNSLIGGLFLFNEVEQQLSLLSAYGVEDLDTLKRTFKADEGLPGRCFQSAEIVVIKDVPPSYHKITSGMGSLQPSELIFVPLIIFERPFGVIELGGFETYTDEKISFIRTISEMSAINLNSTIINAKNAGLVEELKILREAAQKRTELQYEAQQSLFMKTREKWELREKELLQQIGHLESEIKNLNHGKNNSLKE